MRTVTPVVALVVAAFASSAAAQDSAPGSRPWEPVRFHPAADRAPLEHPAPVVKASHAGGELVVLADGNAEYAFTDSSPGEGREARRERWVARIPVEAVERLAAAVRSSQEGGAIPSFERLLDVARVPSWIRESSKPGSYWPYRHQDSDGSWSPADFDWNCSDEGPCTGIGKESFRVAATALTLQCLTGAGYPSAGDSLGWLNVAPRRSINWLISRQQADGGFAAPGAPSRNMTNACAAVALSRALVHASRAGELRPAQLAARAEKAVRRIAMDQTRSGGWVGEEDLGRRLSADVWCLLALKAGSTAGLPIADLDAKMRGVLMPVEQAVVWTGAPPAPHKVTPELRLHARAVRAVVRAACGEKPEFLAEDVAFVLETLKPDQDSPPDAEVLLFTTIAAMKCSDPLRDQFLKQVKTWVIESQVKDGCASGTWSTPTLWWNDGGRLVSTALMTWVLELYYRYPHADWI